MFTITITDRIYLSVFDRVLKHLPLLLPTDISLVSSVENADERIPSVMFSQEIFFCRTSPSVRPSVVGFFISDRISNRMGNYRRSVFGRTDSIGEVVGKNVTDGKGPFW